MAKAPTNITIEMSDEDRLLLEDIRQMLRAMVETNADDPEPAPEPVPAYEVGALYLLTWRVEGTEYSGAFQWTGSEWFDRLGARMLGPHASITLAERVWTYDPATQVVIYKADLFDARAQHWDLAARNAAAWAYPYPGWSAVFAAIAKALREQEARS